MSISTTPNGLSKALKYYYGTSYVSLERIIHVMTMYKHEHGSIPTQWCVYGKALIAAVSQLQLTNTTKEYTMSNLFTLEARKLAWISEIIEEDSNYTVEELHSMSMVEIRDIRDELLPLCIVSITGTAGSGKSIRYTKIKAS
jgi:hypothetical protein